MTVSATAAASASATASALAAAIVAAAAIATAAVAAEAAVPAARSHANVRASAPSGADAAAFQAAAAHLGDLGLALLREAPGTNAVVSPLAVATVLGMVQAGATGATEREIEALFGGGRTGAAAMRRSLPALSAQLRSGGDSLAAASASRNHSSNAGAGATPTTSAVPASAIRTAAAPNAAGQPTRQAARIWIDGTVAKDVPASYKRRLAERHGADALVLSFADSEGARTQINRWTAEHTAGRIAELLPAGSLAKSTQVTLTAALHFRAPWQQPFEAESTDARPFITAAGTSSAVPTLQDVRAVAQATLDGAQLYAVPFAAGYDLVIAMPTEPTGSVQALLQGASGAGFARWQAALGSATPARCSFALPKFSFAPKAGSIKAALERLGVRAAFTKRAELRPMLGRAAPGVHVDDVHHAAGITIDEQGGEAVAAAAATVKPKSLTAAPPPCAVDRAFAFVVMHRASGAPLFVGRVGDPALSE